MDSKYEIGDINNLKNPNWYLQKYLELINNSLHTGKTFIEINRLNYKVQSSYVFNRIKEVKIE